jgi:hypothetical protein
MKNLEHYIKAYRNDLKDLLFDIQQKEHLKKEWDYGIEINIDNISTDRNIIEHLKYKLTPEQEREVEKLDKKLLEIYESLKGTQYEELFINYLKPYLPVITTV